MKGFFATVPEAEIKSIFDGVRRGAESSKDLNPEQKKALREMIEEQTREIMALREGGKPFAAVVAPLAPRIRKFTMDNLADR